MNRLKVITRHDVDIHFRSRWVCVWFEVVRRCDYWSPHDAGTTATVLVVDPGSTPCRTHYKRHIHYGAELCN